MTDTPADGSKKISIEPLPITEYYSIIRSQIEHEDNLMGTRLNWFITSQSFFFTAYAIDVTSIKAGPATAGNDLSDIRVLLQILIPVVATVASVLILFTIASGILAMHNLRMLFHKHIDKSRSFDLPPLQGNTSTWAMGLAAPVLLPVVFLVIWSFLLMHAH